MSGATSSSSAPASGIVPPGFAEDTRTMRERMVAGELYLAEDPELVTASRRAYRLMKAHEAAYAVSVEESQAVLKELLGECADDVHIKPPFSVDYGANIRIGRGSFANFGLVALDVCPITIGEDVLIATNVQLLTPTHPIDPVLRRAKWEAAGPIVIEDNVWLGAGVIVLANVTIGKNSIIGAGAVVTKSIPANCVAVGNPAKVIKRIEEGPDAKDPATQAQEAAAAATQAN